MPDVMQRSATSMMQNAKNINKAYDRTWKASARAPIFCKIKRKAVGDKGKFKKTYRTSRLIGNHAYNIAASGAAAKRGLRG